TETLTHIAARPVNMSEKKPPFKVLDGVEISQDERECLTIKAPRVSDAVIHTNDRVQLQNETEFYLLGRVDNIINSGGIKLQPEEVEHHLERLITSRFFITGLPDKTMGEKPVLIIEDTYSEEKTNRLKEAIAQLEDLHPYKKPKAIYYLPLFEETHSGKINRQKTVQKIQG